MAKKALIGAIMACGCLASQVSAHHAYAPEFGPSLVSCAQGVVTEVRWRSPHIQVDVNLNGRFEQPFEAITLQSQDPGILKRNYDLDATTLKEGDAVLVRGRLSAQGTNIFQMLSLSVNGSDEIPLSTRGIPEIGQLREATTRQSRDAIRQEREKGASVAVETSCESFALF